MMVAALLAAGGLAAGPSPGLSQTVEGEVRTRGRWQPVAGVRVMLLDGDAVVVDSAVTDADGRFVVRAPEPGGYVLHVRGTGYASRTRPVRLESGRATAVELGLNPVADGVVRRLRRVLAERPFAEGFAAVCGDERPVSWQGMLYGAVRDGRTGEPVPNALVRLEEIPRGEGVVRVVTAVSGGDGTFLLCRVSPGIAHVRVAADGYRGTQRPAELRPGMVGRLAIELRPVP